MRSQAAPARSGRSSRANQSVKTVAGFAGITIYAAAIFTAAGAPAYAGIAGNNYAAGWLRAGAHNRRIGYAAGPAPRGEIIPASLGGLARSHLPSGVYPASSSVTTSCFNARMINLLATIQRKYHRPMIITSGYRSYLHNISAGGVRGSLHTACAAADIKIPGVNKFQLASYVRSLPNRGGVGLYCHDAVHVDIGAPREWNWCAAGSKHSHARYHH